MFERLFARRSEKPETDERRTGRRGEEAAARYLKKKGYRILDRNVLFRGGELDIVARDGGVLVFAEVKTRAEGAMVPATEAVDRAKAYRTIRAAGMYLAAHPEETGPARFDVIAIDGGRITHVENAFDAKYPYRR